MRSAGPQVSNTPLKWYKMDTYGGGVRSPLIMHWPARFKRRRPADQYHHAIDLMPTVLDLLGIKAPDSYRGVPQLPVARRPAWPTTFNAAEAPTRKVSSSSRWSAIARSGIAAGRRLRATARHRLRDRSAGRLYHLDEDFSECQDLAQGHPEKLKQLIDLWWTEARTFGHALPLDDKWAADRTSIEA